MNRRKRTVQVKFYVTEEERKLIEEKMKLNSRPSYKSLKNLLVSMKYNPEEMMPDSSSTESTRPRGITRGASYYGGKKS